MAAWVARAYQADKADVERKERVSYGANEHHRASAVTGFNLLQNALVEKDRVRRQLLCPEIVLNLDTMKARRVVGWLFVYFSGQWRVTLVPLLADLISLVSPMRALQL